MYCYLNLLMDYNNTKSIHFYRTLRRYLTKIVQIIIGEKDFIKYT